MERYIIPSVYQAIQLYRILMRAERGMSSLELEEALQLPRSTVFRLLKTLLNQYLISKRGTRFYVDNGMHTMGMVSPAIQQYQSDLASPLAELIEHTTHVAMLCIPANDCALVQDVVCMDSASMALVRPGFRLPLLDSAPGHIMLAYHSRYRQIAGSDASGNPDSLRAEKISAQTCTRGYAVSLGFNQQQTLVAVPVLSKSGELLAILCMLVNGTDITTDASELSHWSAQLKLVASMPAREYLTDKKEAG